MFLLFVSVCVCVFWLKHKAENSQIITPLKNRHENEWPSIFAAFIQPELVDGGNALWKSWGIIGESNKSFSIARTFLWFWYVEHWEGSLIELMML